MNILSPVFALGILLSLSTPTVRAASLVNKSSSNANTVSLFEDTNPPASVAKRPAIVKPVLKFERVCDPLVGYSGLYRRHPLVLPLAISLSRSSNAPADYVATDIKLSVDEALKSTLLDGSESSTVKLLVQLKRRQPDEIGAGQLVFLCSDFTRCQQLRESIEDDPEELWRSIRFSIELKPTVEPSSNVESKVIRFDNLRPVNLPELACESRSDWIVFQRRVDGNLSFAKNWDAYVNGFGNPESNYWMGLERLFQLTATGKKSSYHDTSRCRLRIDLRDFNGNSYRSEYGLFQVLDSGQNYRLRVGQKVPNSQIDGFASVHSESQFSTYERSNDRLPGDSCSQLYGFGGWWYNACHHVNLNGAYLTNRNITDSPIYASFRRDGKFVPSCLPR
ncbi:hypothetical protein BOX15_Mlig028435g3 [Macrostomum lignano]|uniref:Fibrinogen C-terminal domain-containing protein n=1 Tax=Macrostomum lignano TaxID=282301 RepID=A0A267DGA7_9PLAT|nr:hypothetical protein BOX15_Mlig028435g3 [Macrostomum lignano]